MFSSIFPCNVIQYEFLGDTCRCVMYQFACFMRRIKGLSYSVCLILLGSREIDEFVFM